MTTCPRCASELRDGWKFCVMCGERRAAGTGQGGGRMTSAGLVVLISASAIAAVIVGGLVALVLALM